MARERGWAAAAPLALAAVLVWGGYRTAFRPARVAALGAAEAAVGGLEQRLRRSEALSPDLDTAEADRVREELRRLETDMDGRSGVLASRAEGDQILASLSALAAEEGVRFRRFAPEPEYRIEEYAVRAAVVAAEGGFYDFLRFFERVGAMTPMVLIEEAEFETSGHDDGRLHARFVAVSVRAAETPPAAP